MAKKMVEEVILAEKEAQSIVENAKLKAQEILKQAEDEAKRKDSLEIEKANQKAIEIIENAEKTADEIKTLAESEALAEREDLQRIFNSSLESAVETAVSLLI